MIRRPRFFRKTKKHDDKLDSSNRNHHHHDDGGSSIADSMSDTSNSGYETPEKIFHKKSHSGSVATEETTAEASSSYSYSTGGGVIEESTSPLSFNPFEERAQQQRFKAPNQQYRDPREWHEVLVEAEASRRNESKKNMNHYETQYDGLIQLLKIAEHETSLAHRWTAGVAIAQQKLAQALSIVPSFDDSENNDNDEDAKSKDFNLDNDDDDDDLALPEKLKQQQDDDNGTNAAAIPKDDEDETTTDAADGNNKNNKLITGRSFRLTTSSRALPSVADENKPPVQFIEIPNSQMQQEAAFIIIKQHEVMKQAILGNEISVTDKIKELKEQSITRIDEIKDIATPIIQTLQSTEEKVQNAWDSYFTKAEEYFGSVESEDSSSDDPKYSMGDVWVAELAYRSAVVVQYHEYEELVAGKLEDALCHAKEGERQRRLKLRWFLHHGIMQKHAEAFQRIHQAHSDALEEWMAHNGVDDEPDEEDNKSEKTKKRKSKKSKKALSTNERIQQIAEFNGATPVFETPKLTNDNVTKKVTAATDPINIIEEMGGIDVDMYVDLSDDDEEALPLLSDAKTKRRSRKSSSKSSSRVSSSSVKPYQPKKNSEKKTRNSKKLRDAMLKVNSVVVLDQRSKKHAYFMDQLLYSASLLESHFVLFSAVAGFDDDRIRPIVHKHKEEVPAHAALIVVTCDLVLHAFEIPTTPDRVLSPGSSPEVALRFLLQQNHADDLKIKEEQANKEDPSSSGLLFLRSNKQQASSTEESTYRFSNLIPSASMYLPDCMVRMTRRGEHAVKISSKTRPLVDNLRFSKLNFATKEDQIALLDASRYREEALMAVI